MEIREVTYLAIIIRILAAVIIGGLLGLERGMKHRPAGLRTYMLVCVGSCVIMLTNQYIYQAFGAGDPVRMGSQVVSGIGFWGAGTIVVTRRSQIKGLTTAAGLWTAAIVGLALGGGFYEGGIFVTALIMLAELVFSKLEYLILNNAPEVNLYLEYLHKPCLDAVLKLLRNQNVKVLDLEITRAEGSEKHHACAIFSLRLHKKVRLEQLLVAIEAIDGTILVEEL